MYNRKIQNVMYLYIKHVLHPVETWNVFLYKSSFFFCLWNVFDRWIQRQAETNFQRHQIDFLIKTEKKKKHFITPAISRCVQLSAPGPRRGSIWTAGIQPVARHVESSAAAICPLISKLRRCTRRSRSWGTGRYTWRRGGGGKKK